MGCFLSESWNGRGQGRGVCGVGGGDGVRIDGFGMAFLERYPVLTFGLLFYCIALRMLNGLALWRGMC